MTKDVYLFDTPDGGDVTQDLEIRDGLENSVYLSLFGGNAKDDGMPESLFKWWGNIGENVEARVYRSEAAYLLRSVPPVPKNLRRIEDGAKRDLAWLVTDGITENLKVTATMPALNFVRLQVFLDGIDPLEFRSSWTDKTEEQLSKIIQPPEVLINNGIELSGTGLPRAIFNLIRANGEIIQVEISANGAWKIEPYPLDNGEAATAFISTLSGLSSRGKTIIGVVALLYDGAVFYDGSQEYDALRNV